MLSSFHLKEKIQDGTSCKNLIKLFMQISSLKIITASQLKNHISEIHRKQYKIYLCTFQ